MITKRRQLLDFYLQKNTPLMVGDVLDIGGKKDNKRGEFRPPIDRVSSWKYLNIDSSCSPDFCCSADEMPVADGTFDTALLCEVIEHLAEPEKVIQESCRVLKPGGYLLASIPFLFPIHADPHDYQRWTDTKIKAAFGVGGFSDVAIEAMGGAGAVIHDLLLVTVNGLMNDRQRAVGKRLIRLTQPLFKYLEGISDERCRRITTGYFVVARK